MLIISFNLLRTTFPALLLVPMIVSKTLTPPFFLISSTFAHTLSGKPTDCTVASIDAGKPIAANDSRAT